MALSSFITQLGGPSVKSSIPLASRRLGESLGFSLQKTDLKEPEKKILIELSRTNSGLEMARRKVGLPTQSLATAPVPLTQALGALSELAEKIDNLQQRYQKATKGSSLSESLASELQGMAQEFKNITSKDIFKNHLSPSNNSGALDSEVKELFQSGNQARVETLTKGLQALQDLSFDNILEDRNITSSIKDVINSINAALSPGKESFLKQALKKEDNRTITIPIPQATIRTAHQATGLSISLLSLSNEGLIKAAAMHLDLSSTNVLLLTFNEQEYKPETKTEKELREKKSTQIQIENPSFES